MKQPHATHYQLPTFPFPGDIPRVDARRSTPVNPKTNTKD